MEFFTIDVILALVYIIFTNIILSGDNAVVIALASRNLPKETQGKAIFWGSTAAIVLRVILTLVAVQLLALPYLKIVGAALLLYIGIQLMLDAGDDDDGIKSPPSMMQAIRTILIADLVMSVDNVVAVAASANRAPEDIRFILILIGLALSIPLIIFGSTILIKIMDRYPMIITLGAALIGFLAGEMFATDPVIKDILTQYLEDPSTPFQIAGILIVVVGGLWLRKKSPE